MFEKFELTCSQVDTSTFDSPLGTTAINIIDGKETDFTAPPLFSSDFKQAFTFRQWNKPEIRVYELEDGEFKLVFSHTQKNEITGPIWGKGTKIIFYTRHLGRVNRQVDEKESLS